MLILPSLVHESTADGFVSENALAGAIPTEIGQLTQLTVLGLLKNQLTGASNKTRLIAILVYESTAVFCAKKMRWCQPAQRACACSVNSPHVTLRGSGLVAQAKTRSGRS